MRYVNYQLKDWDCAPIALINMFKWCGYRIPLKKYWTAFCEISNTDENGCLDSDFLKALKFYRGFIHIQKQREKSWQKIRNWVDKKDQAAIISFSDMDGVPHWAFFDGQLCPNHCLGEFSVEKLKKAFESDDYFAVLVKR